MRTWSKTVLWVTLAVSVQGAMAELMRCGDTVIDDAQDVPVTQEQVLAACGQPSSPESWSSVPTETCRASPSSLPASDE
jgi:hypothetical protein